MKPDTRANVIFLSLFLAISLPGAVILFKKKLDPAVPPMYMPDQPRTRLPFVALRDAPDLTRYIPEKTGLWLTTLARAHGLNDVLLADDRLPPMSPTRTVQLAGVQSDGATAKVSLILWLDEVASPADVSLTDGAVDDVTPVPIPPDVRKELIYSGFPQPPHDVAWVNLHVPQHTPPPAALHINIRGHEESVPFLAHH